MDIIYCKICGKRLTSEDKYFNQYDICKKCLDKDKLKSLTDQKNKRGLK